MSTYTYESMNGIAIGWELLQQDSLLSYTLQQVQLPVISYTNEYCRNIVYDNIIQFCADFIQGAPAEFNNRPARQQDRYRRDENHGQEPENGNTGQGVETGNGVQETENGNDAQQPDNGNGAQQPDNGNDAQQPDNGNTGQGVETGNGVQETGNDAQQPDNGNGAQQPDNENDAQQPDNGNDAQQPDNGNGAQQPDNGNDAQQPDNGNTGQGVETGNGVQGTGNDAQQPDNGNTGQGVETGNGVQEAGNDAQQPDNGNDAQQPDNKNGAQQPDNGNDAQPPDNGNGVQELDNGNDAQQPDNGNVLQYPGNLNSGEGLENANSGQANDESDNHESPEIVHDFEIQFRNRYFPTIMVPKNYDKLKQRTQSCDEPITSYIDDIINLCREIDPTMSDSIFMQHLMSEINPDFRKEMSRHVSCMNTLNEFLKYAKIEPALYDTFEKSRQLSIESKQSNFTFNHSRISTLTAMIKQPKFRYHYIKQNSRSHFLS
ncbi:unnamed protein product [Rotaria sordida]|uniref:Uncharacterized protein n=2 Tax=Rotaria sordida TaxID=392033 RepID=A0A814D436_9BILA|nr:unnamed protein product [Rotaria sordida]